jgi:hypothetical protein
MELQEFSRRKRCHSDDLCRWVWTADYCPKAHSCNFYQASYCQALVTLVSRLS